MGSAKFSANQLRWITFLYIFISWHSLCDLKLIEAKLLIYPSVSKAITGSDNGLLPKRRHAIIWTNADILSIRSWVTYFIEILFNLHWFSFKKMQLKMSSGKWRPFCLGLNVLSLLKPQQLWIVKNRAVNTLSDHYSAFLISHGHFSQKNLWKTPYSSPVKVRYGVSFMRFSFITLKPRQNWYHFANDIFKCIFLNENAWISRKISLKFVPKGPVNNIPALVQIMAWPWPGNKPLSGPVMVGLLMHKCISWPQWAKQNFTIAFVVLGNIMLW